MIAVHIITLLAALAAAIFAGRAVSILRHLAAPAPTTVVNPTIQLEQEGTPA